MQLEMITFDVQSFAIEIDGAPVGTLERCDGEWERSPIRFSDVYQENDEIVEAVSKSIDAGMSGHHTTLRSGREMLITWREVPTEADELA